MRFYEYIFIGLAVVLFAQFSSGAELTFLFQGPSSDPAFGMVLDSRESVREGNRAIVEKCLQTASQDKVSVKHGAVAL
jgi:hypothetical protein